MRQPAQLHKIAGSGHRLCGEGAAVEVVEGGGDQLTQRLLVDVGQPLQIQARLAGAVRAEPGEQLLVLGEPGRDVDGERLLAR
jgi:hypothetical protein